MLTHRRVALVALVAGLSLSLLPSGARADDGWGNTECHDGQPKPGCDVSAGTGGQHTGQTGGRNSRESGACYNPQGEVIPCQRDGAWAGADGCYYKPADLSPDTVTALGGQPSGPGGWYVRTCYGADGAATSGMGGVLWMTTPPVASPEVLARQARSMLTLPDVVIRVNPAGDQLVGLPTWLALDTASWRAQSATASVPGVSVTATALPVKATWAMGDGNTVVCNGPGTPWRPGMDPAATSPDCGHRYLRSSAHVAGAAYTVKVAVSWEVTWAGAGQSGTIPGLTTTGSVPVRVAESQAVITA